MVEAKIKKAWYKSWWAITLFVIIGLMIIGGISSNNQTPTKGSNSAIPNQAQTQPPAETSKELTLKVGETAKTSTIEVAVLSAIKGKSYDYYSDIYKRDTKQESSAGKAFILVDAEIKNVGADRVYVGASQFSITDSEGYKYDPDALYLGNDGLDFFKELYQNQKMKGKILFEVPENAQGLKLQYDFGNIVTGTKLASWTL